MLFHLSIFLNKIFRYHCMFSKLSSCICSEWYSNDFIFYYGLCFYRITEIEFFLGGQDHYEAVGGWTGVTGRWQGMVNKCPIKSSLDFELWYFWPWFFIRKNKFHVQYMYFNLKILNNDIVGLLAVEKNSMNLNLEIENIPISLLEDLVLKEINIV